VAEVEFTAFASTKHPITARLIVRRVRDQARLAELFPVWRYHPFFTDNTEPLAQADITHRRHAIIETVFADLIAGPLAHQPSSRFGANNAWTQCAVMTHKPAARRRHPHQRQARRRARCDAAPPDHHRPGPTGPATTPARAAPAPTLAMGPTLEHPLAQRVPRRDRTAGRKLNPANQPAPGRPA